VPGVGHSMNLEQPALYAGYFGAWFGGISSDASDQISAQSLDRS
jgi:non-heme chloroperoxidase